MKKVRFKKCDDVKAVQDGLPFAMKNSKRLIQGVMVNVRIERPMNIYAEETNKEKEILM